MATCQSCTSSSANSFCTPTWLQYRGNTLMKRKVNSFLLWILLTTSWRELLMIWHSCLQEYFPLYSMERYMHFSHSSFLTPSVLLSFLNSFFVFYVSFFLFYFLFHMCIQFFHLLLSGLEYIRQLCAPEYNTVEMEVSTK